MCSFRLLQTSSSGLLPARVPMSALLSGYRSHRTYGSDRPHGSHRAYRSDRPYGSNRAYRSDWPHGSNRTRRSNRGYRRNRCRRRRFNTGTDFRIFYAASKRYGRRRADF